MRIIGIDPGVNGALAILSETGSFVDVMDMPTVIANQSTKARQMIDAFTLSAMLRTQVAEARGEIVAITENVNAMPDWGSSALFAFGKSFGMVLGVLAALGVSYEIIAPPRWKKHFGLGREKDHARELAIRTWPVAPLSLKKHHNRAEALLIAKYYRDVLVPRVLKEGVPF